MITGIKNLINSKIALQESAEVILEGSTGRDLDDLIVLGEETELGEFDETPAEPEPAGDGEEPGDGEELKDDGGDIDTAPVEDNGDAMNDDIDAAPDPEGDNDNGDGALPGPEDNGESEHDMMNADIDELPTPVGDQTGEPVKDNVDDFMNVEIDMRSNTLSDVLPVPPANAGEAIGSDDIMNQRIDSGFGGEEPSPASPATPPVDQEESVDDMMSADFTEAISLDGGADPAPADGGATDSFGDPGPVDDGTAADTGADPAPADGGEENAVTAAVRDKVAEADSTVDGGTGQAASKEELLKKLGNITKNLEDAKKAVMDSLT